MLQDKKKTESLLQEDSRVKSQRKSLQKRLQRLSQARDLLLEFSMNIYNFSTPEFADEYEFEDEFEDE